MITASKIKEGVLICLVAAVVVCFLAPLALAVGIMITMPLRAHIHDGMTLFWFQSGLQVLVITSLFFVSLLMLYKYVKNKHLVSVVYASFVSLFLLLIYNWILDLRAYRFIVVFIFQVLLIFAISFVLPSKQSKLKASADHPS